MKDDSQMFVNSRAGQTIYGRRIQPGEVLQATDVYDSTSGRWENCPCPGLTLQEGADAVWVRPGPVRL